MRLEVWLEARTDPVGVLERREDASLSFTYAGGTPREGRLSMSLPVREEPYGDAACTAFFGNLLFEGRELERVKAAHGIDRDDIATLLYHLGADCPGAISITPEGAGPGKRPGIFPDDYEEIPPERMTEIVSGLHFDGTLPEDAQDPSPLAGVQPKFAVVAHDGRYFQPRAGSRAPTTHILKVSPRKDPDLTRRESALIDLARTIGLDVIESEYREFHDGATAFEIGTILSKRFDRDWQDREIHRLHSEDFCQALGLARQLKYERDAVPGGPCFSAAGIGEIATRTSVPAMFQMEFLRHTLFNLAVGNTDNHAKNAAILYRGASGVLAPLYDVVPVIMDERVTHTFAFAIGAAHLAEDLQISDIEAMMVDFGFRRPDVSKPLHKVLTDVATGIDQLATDGDKLLADAIAAQLTVLNDAMELGLEIPPRDYFPRKTHDEQVNRGGWGNLS